MHTSSRLFFALLAAFSISSLPGRSQEAPAETLPAPRSFSSTAAESLPDTSGIARRLKPERHPRGTSAWALPDTSGIARRLELHEVVVTGTRNATDIRHLPMTVSVVSHPQIEESHETSLLPLLNEHVPGLFVTSRGVLGYGVSDGAAGGISLRGIGGGSSSQMLVLIDGHPQYMGLFGHPIADICQSLMAERVEVLRGPASVLYGSNAMGGVINIVTRQMQEDGIRTSVDVGAGTYGTLHAQASNRIRKGKFSSIVAASYDRTNGHRPDMGFEQFSGFAKLGYAFGKHWKIGGNANATHFNASNPGTVDNPVYDNDSRITRGMVSVALENHYEKTSGALSLFCNWGRHRINDGYQAGEEPLDYRFNSRDQMMGASLYQSASFFKGNRITAGIDYYRFGGDSWNHYLSTGEDEPGADHHLDEVAAYADFRQDIGKWLSLDAGIRFDYHSRTGGEWIPQGGLAFHLPQNAEIKVMAGKGFRNPTIREMYMFPPQNPDLQPERLMSYELSFSQHLLQGALRYGINIFYINGDNIIYVDRSSGRPLNVNGGQIENCGIEADFGYRVAQSWHVHANYSYLHMEHPVLASPEHKLFAGLDFRSGRWSASTGIQYISGLYTSVEASRLEQEDYVLWNLSAGVKVGGIAQIYIKADNLLGQRYEINAGYPMPRFAFLGGIRLDF